MYTYDQFVDDTNCVIEAKVEYISTTFDILCLMGKSSGLFVKEVNVKVVYISEGPLPPELLTLDMAWEDSDNPSKLLGFFVGMELHPDIMNSRLAEILESRLQKAKMRHYSLSTRVCIANYLVIFWSWLHVAAMD